MIQLLNNEWVREWESARSAGSQRLWMGALSFEDRCLGSSIYMRQHDISANRGIVLEYETNVRPIDEDRSRRDRNREYLNRKGASLFGDNLSFRKINATALKEFHHILRSDLAASPVGFAAFDITCMTKLHTLALATFLATTRVPFRWVIAYTVPDNYGDHNNAEFTEWNDVLIAPLAETAQLLFEAHSRGIVSAGHEARRLLVALAEIEPSGGIILINDAPRRPDLRRTCERANGHVLRQLVKLRSSEWSQAIVGSNDFPQISELVKREIGKAKEWGAPVILFPFGPKAVLFEIGFLMAGLYPESSWFVYPVPTRYDVNYSEGVSSTWWFGPETEFAKVTREEDPRGRAGV